MPIREKFLKPYTILSAMLYLMFRMVRFCKWKTLQDWLVVFYVGHICSKYVNQNHIMM